MEKEGFSPDPQRTPRPSLAEEQRRAFEEDHRRQRPQGLRWPGFLFRN
jgi:hypothetical protein